MVNVVKRHGEGLDIYTRDKWGDCRIELEVMVPRGSNSGIYLMGEYEIQVTSGTKNATLPATLSREGATVTCKLE